jgi:hypothetical protein
LLIVFAEAFDRDEDPQDFSLESIIAHECGHQALYRNPRIVRHVTARIGDANHEILASVLGSLIVTAVEDSQALLLKALGEMIDRGMTDDKAVRLLHELRAILGKLR